MRPRLPYVLAGVALLALIGVLAGVALLALIGVLATFAVVVARDEEPEAVVVAPGLGMNGDMSGMMGMGGGFGPTSVEPSTRWQ